jgi:CRISPR-associated endonuclease Cas3-HD
MTMRKVITPSDAFAAYERAFRAGSPREVEELLREMLNVQVAAVKDKDQAEEELRQGKRLKTVSVPYGVFLGKIKGKSVYRLESSAQKKNQSFLVEVKSDEDIRPNFTYVLLAEEAGYSPGKGLTFEEDGKETGFEPQPNAEMREKTTTGRFQKWEEHAKGVWERSERITKSSRPFIERWAKEALGLDDAQLQSFVDSLIWAMRIAVYLHDVGKLNKQWQEVVWQNEQKVSGKTRDGYIARTSSLSNAEQKKELASPPPHAPFAYPFLQALLRKVLGDYRFLDTIALAAARHHSLEVTGAIEGGKFEWDEWNGQKVNEWLQDQLCQLLDLSGDEVQQIQEAISEAAKRITEASKADEPPGPTDDFYFLYCIANRLVKVCDWEDAGDTNLELR